MRFAAAVGELLLALIGALAFHAMGASWTTLAVIALCAAAGTAVLRTGLLHRRR